MSNSRILSLLQPQEWADLKLARKPTDLEIVRWAANRSFIAFCCAVMPHYTPTRFHQLLADKLQDLFERVMLGEDVKLMVEMPPRHGKTQLVSRLFPAWVLGKTKHTPIICTSYGSTLAENNSQDCRDIVNSEMYQWIFPNTRLNPDSTSKEFWKTTTGGSYRAAGVGSTLTGLGGKFLICDDPFKDRADADSETIRESTWKWWQSVFMTRREGLGTGVVVLNTRWHLDDLTGRLLDQDKEKENKEWERFRFPAVAEEDEYIDGQLFRKAGEVLWPEKFPLEHLMVTKENTDVYEWSSLYQQSPILTENAEFRREHFRYYEPEQLVGKQLYYTTTADLAISQKKTADYTVILTVGKEVDGPNWYIMDITAGRMDPLQTIDAIFHHWEQYRSKVYIESVGYQASLQYFLIEEQRKRNKFFTVEELKVKTTSKKEERIRGLIPLYKAGVIYHRKGLCEQLELEEMQFPKGRHDDNVDALSMHLGIIRHTPRESEEKQEGRFNWRKKVKTEGGFDPYKPFDRV